MNLLGKNILKILKTTPLGENSIHLLNRQSELAGIDFENITVSDLPKLMTQLETSLPLFIGHRTEEVLKKIQAFHSSAEGAQQPVQISVTPTYQKNVQEQIFTSPVESVAKKKSVMFEESPISDEEHKKGESYLIYEKGNQRTFTIVKKALKFGATGLVISREYYEKLIEKYNLAEFSDLKFFWLSRIEGKDVISPTNVEQIMSIIDEFLRNNKDKETLVLIDGVEYLMVHNNFTTIIKLIHELNDIITITKSRLYIPLDAETLTDDKRALIERDMHVIGKS